MKKKRKGHFWRGVFVLAVLAVFVRMGFNEDLTVREYTVFSDKVKQPHTFALITDLHCTLFGENQCELVELVELYVPDAVLLAGDLADNEGEISHTTALVSALSERYPCYFVTGNHERWCEADPDMKAFFERFGVVSLSATSLDVTFGSDTIRIHGMDDPLFYDNTDAFKEALAALPLSRDGFDILLSHRPEHAEFYGSLGFELTVSGHSHGGQIRIPLLLNGLYVPGQGWHPTYAGGQYTFAEGDVIVSRGLAIDEKPRFYNPPELVMIHVVPDAE